MAGKDRRDDPSDPGSFCLAGGVCGHRWYPYGFDPLRPDP